MCHVQKQTGKRMGWLAMAIMLCLGFGATSWSREPKNTIGVGVIAPEVHPYVTYERQIHPHWYVRMSFFMARCPDCEPPYIYLFPVQLVRSFRIKDQVHVNAGAGLLPIVADRELVFIPFPAIDVSLRFLQPNWMIGVGLYLIPPTFYITTGLRF